MAEFDFIGIPELKKSDHSLDEFAFTGIPELASPFEGSFGALPTTAEPEEERGVFGEFGVGLKRGAISGFGLLHAAGGALSLAVGDEDRAASRITEY